MTALTVTKAQVVYASGPVLPDAYAGEAIDAGDAVYLNDSGQWLKAQCDGTALEAGANNCGLALATADALGARFSVALPGATVTLGAGAAPAAGTVYFIGATPGDLIPAGDLSSGNKVTPVALGIGTNKVKVLRDYDAGSVKP
jgi:hypothetical protein